MNFHIVGTASSDGRHTLNRSSTSKKIAEPFSYIDTLFLFVIPLLSGNCVRPTISCKIVEPLRKNKVFWPPSPHCNVDWKQM